MLCPADAVVEHLLIFQQLVHLYITSMVGGIIPKRPYFRWVVRLPVGVHLPNDVLYLFDN